MVNDPAIYAVKPHIVERACGGWMAMTPRGWPLSIGVTAETETEAREAFDAALARWARIAEGQDESKTQKEKTDGR